MDKTNELARIFKCLAVEARLKIIQMLHGRVLCVNALAANLNLTQGAVSQHLRILRDAGLVVPEKRGYWVHYRLNEDTLTRWREAAAGILAPAQAQPLGLPVKLKKTEEE